uniref:VWFA domain-containing protein n=1 Tax=Myripristis murdjan TaxID=586833 RepID=A0A667YVW4_9TELE
MLRCSHDSCSHLEPWQAFCQFPTVTLGARVFVFSALLKGPLIIDGRRQLYPVHFPIFSKPYKVFKPEAFSSQACFLIWLATLDLLPTTVADIVFLVDGSSSIGIDNFQEVRQFLRKFIEGLDIGADKVRVGLAQYSNEPHQEFLLKDHMDKQSLLAQVDNLPYRTGGTATGKAISFLETQYFTAQAGSRADQRVPQIAIVITDGDSEDDVIAPAQQLRKQGVIIFGIGVGAANMMELQGVTNRPHERFLFSIDNYQALQRLIDSLLQTVCVSMEDQRQALVKRFADIFFLVDNSLSQQDFQQTRTLLARLVNQLDVGVSAHRIGLAQFGQEPKVEFLLNAYNTKEEISAAVRRFRLRRLQPNEPRNLGRALEYASTQLFTSDAGGREDQGFRQFLVVVSGGDSTDAVFKESRLVKSEGVTVVGIGLGSASLNETKVIATAPYIYQSTNIVPALRSAFETEQELIPLTGDCKSAKLADIVFIVDESGSITTPNFQLIRSFLHKIVDGLDVNPKRVRVGIITYNDRPTGQVYLNTFNDKSETLQFIKILPYRGGGTNTGAALRFARERVFIKEKGSRKSQGVQQVAVVITDGKSQDAVSQEAADLRRAGVTVYAVGIKDANKTELEQMASYPSKKHVFIVDSFAKLKTLEQSLQKILCYNIIRQAITINTRRTGIKEGCIQTDEADIFFLIDHSGSIYPKDFSDMKKFIIEFLDTFRIGPQHVRVGVAKYADSPNLEFDLTTYSDAKSLEKAVENIRQIGGGTQTGAALSFMGPNFERAMGSRGHKVPEYLVVITDGKSSDEVKAPAEKLRAQGVIIYAIGVKNADETELVEIAGNPKKTFFVNDFDALKPIKDDIVTDICSQDDCKKTEVADIIFLVDGSTSITLNKFRSMLKFMESMVNQTTIGEKLTRFGVILFSNDPKSMFTLNKYYSKREIIKAIAALKSPYGDTYTGKALEYSLQFFDAQHGGRAAQKVPQILMVITDGDATDRNNLVGPSEALRDNGVSVISIGVEGAKRDQLEIMAGGDTSRVFYVDNFDHLETLYLNITHVLCNTTKPGKSQNVCCSCKTQIFSNTEMTFPCFALAACEKQKADLVMLLDQSGSISSGDYTIMKTFATELVTSFKVSEEFVRVGVAQFSSYPQKEFYLNEYYTEAEVNKHILNMRQLGGGTNIGQALKFIRDYFQASRGSRIAERISQNLILITDGDSQDDVEDAANDLRALGIEVFAIGIGDVHDLELLQITGNPEKLFTVQNFGSLANIKQKVVDTICKSKPQKDPSDCSVDIAMGFDISQRSGAPGQLLVSGQLKLERFLPEIVHYVSSMQGLCCTGTTPIKPNIAFRVVSRDGQSLYDFNFEEYNEDVVKKVMNLQMSEATYFNTALLQSFSNKFRAESRAGVKVLVIFSDGLDEDVMKLEQESELLRESGVHALLTVALEGVHDASQLQMVEFGRGFGYKLPLSIGMQSVGSTILKQIDSVADRECCNVMCKCSGHEGIRGSRGPPGPKQLLFVLQGNRGAPGPSGPQGIQERQRHVDSNHYFLSIVKNL